MNPLVFALVVPVLGIRLPVDHALLVNKSAMGLVESQVSAMNLTQCRKVFLDVGSNLGTHVRMIFEGAKYSKSELRSTFEKYFGKEDWRNQPSELSGVCAIGFEANPNLAPRLKDIQTAYNKKGWKAYFITPAAVSDKDGTLKLSVDKAGKGGKLGVSVGSSVVDRTRERHTTWGTATIPSFDFSEFVRNQITNRRGAGGIKHVFAKVDIEGSEFLVIPKLLETRGLCQGNGIDVMTVEWHDAEHRWNHIALKPSGCIQCDKKAIDAAMNKYTQCNLPDIVDIDDESYSKGDPVELPI